MVERIEGFHRVPTVAFPERESLRNLRRNAFRRAPRALEEREDHRVPLEALDAVARAGQPVGVAAEPGGQVVDGDDAGTERADERVWTGAAAIGREHRTYAGASMFAGRPKVEDTLARSEQERRLVRVVLLRMLRDGRRNVDAGRDDEARRRRIGRRGDLGFRDSASTTRGLGNARPWRGTRRAGSP